MEEENRIDQLFKRGLDDPKVPFNELDWENMTRKLDAQEKKRGIPLWLYSAAGIAAVLAIFLFWLGLGPVNLQEKPLVVTTEKPAVGKTLPILPEQKPDALPQVELKTQKELREALAGTMSQGKWRKVDRASAPVSAAAAGNSEAALQSGVAPSAFPSQQTFAAQQGVSVAPSVAAQRPETAQEPGITQRTVLTPAPAVVSTGEPKSADQVTAEKATALAKSRDVYGKVTADEIAHSIKKKMQQQDAASHQLLLSAMAAPDISTAGNSKPSKLSTNLGMLATYALGSRFSLTSGAIYAKKYYNSGGTTPVNSYTPGPATAWEVKADCNVIDIPVNVNYQLLHKKSLLVSVNTGLSSYFMLKEKYQYITGAAGSTQQVSNTEFDNQNQHLFGIANVSVSFDHQISQNLSVGVQPFAKLPLTGIGNNNVNLKSTGVSFSVSIGLFPAKKPGKLAATRFSSSADSSL